jgi:hypothetical protein
MPDSAKLQTGPNVSGKRRADLTYSYNLKSGRHGWLRLTPAYSVKLVHEILASHPDRHSVLDPFSGTGTTPLCAGYLGHSAFAVDINPFLVWFGKTKVRIYDPATLESARRTLDQAIKSFLENNIAPCPPPPINNITRWWDQSSIDFLCRLKATIRDNASDRTPVRDLLSIAFCRTLIRLSNAAFNHQSMSFKSEKGGPKQGNLFAADDPIMMFREDAEYVIESAEENPNPGVDIVGGDSRQIAELTNQRFDIVVTSPPYPNRMSYIRELRPYMYWLDYLYEPREAGDLDWKAMGGTWGVATSRLLEWKPQNQEFHPGYLKKIVSQVTAANDQNGRLLAQYLHKYFEDAWLHLCSLAKVMGKGGTIHYVVGNSTFYGVLVPTEQMYADLMKEAGFSEISITEIRKRNSKKELKEFVVAAYR